MITLASSFLIGYLFFRVTRTSIKSRMDSKFAMIGPGTEELAAPGHLN